MNENMGDIKRSVHIDQMPDNFYKVILTEAEGGGLVEKKVIITTNMTEAFLEGEFWFLGINLPD